MYWLAIETSTRNCSVAVFFEEKCLALREEADPQSYTHAEVLHRFIKEAVVAAKLDFSDIQCVAVGDGPGSYTGLRIGVSAAKGLAYALGIPLLSVSGMLSLRTFWEKNGAHEDVCLCAIDARRMEAYVEIFGTSARELAPLVIESDIFQDIPGRIAVVGDAATKYQSVLTNERYSFYPIYPSAKDMDVEGWRKIRAQEWAELAYYEPGYGKEFVPGIKKG